MSRQMDLLRRTLLAIEQLEGDHPVHSLWIEGCSQHEIGNLVYLLREEGYIEATIPFDSLGAGIATPYFAGGLTWAGRDLLDTIRDDDVWVWVTEKLAGFEGDLTLDIVTTLAFAAEKELSRGSPRPQSPV